MLLKGDSPPKIIFHISVSTSFLCFLGVTPLKYGEGKTFFREELFMGGQRFRGKFIDGLFYMRKLKIR